MKKAILFLHFMFLLILHGNSQNAVIKNENINVLTHDTITINITKNDLDPDEGEYLKLKNIPFMGKKVIKLKTTDSTITFRTHEKCYNDDYIVVTLSEMRSNYELATHLDTIFIKIDNAKWYDTIGVNNITTLLCASGNFFLDEKNIGMFYAPKNSNSNCNYCLNFYSGAFDQTNKYRASAAKFSTHSDYKPGTVVNNTYLNSKYYKQKYYRIWTTTKEQINYHINNWYKIDYKINNSILNWPCNGDTTQGEMFLMAPFFDSNNNNIYEPLIGEYPIIKGDQCTYFIFNDNILQYYTQGESLGIEAHGIVYAFNSNQKAIYNSLFFELDIFNRSKNIYRDFQFGLFDDFDLGDYNDDYVGCDTSLNLFFGYNGSKFDNIYKNSPPALGIMLLNNNIYSFIYDENYNTFNLKDSNIFNLLNGKFLNGSNVYYGGNGNYGNLGVSNVIVNKMFFGDINDSIQWSELSTIQIPGDRLINLSAKPVKQFRPLDKYQFDFALIFAQDSSLNHIQNVGLLKQYAQSIKEFYQVIGKDEIILSENIINIYPNPTKNVLYISINNDYKFYNINIYDFTGKLMLTKKNINKNDFVNISDFKAGMYIVNISNDTYNSSHKIIKF